VPDEYTWASQLQQQLAAIPEARDIEVVNCGIPAAVSIEEVERLEYEISRNNIPDFCVFLNGINDANQGVVNGNPGSTVHQALQGYSKRGLMGVLMKIARLSVAARTIRDWVVAAQRQNVPAPRPEAEVRELANAVAGAYERNMIRAKEICDRHGIRMIVCLQPHVFTISGRPLTPDESAAAARTRKDYADALAACYPLLREKLGLLRQRGVPAFDITDAFNGNFEPIFVDSLFHVESTGNRLIADAILKRARPVLSDSASSRTTEPQPGPDRHAKR
jgi:hypothetical protein